MNILPFLILATAGAICYVIGMCTLASNPNARDTWRHPSAASKWGMAAIALILTACAVMFV